MSANVVLLDRVLAHYGPESKEARDLLHVLVAHVLDRMWTTGGTSPSSSEPASTNAEVLFDKIQELSPKDDVQRALKVEALSVATDVGKTRWLMYMRQALSISTPMLVVVVFWLTALFTSFGLFVPRNATAIASLFLSALSVSGAILLILEMYNPYGGLIQISDAPLRIALAQLER